MVVTVLMLICSLTCARNADTARIDNNCNKLADIMVDAGGRFAPCRPAIHRYISVSIAALDNALQCHTILWLPCMDAKTSQRNSKS